MLRKIWTLCLALTYVVLSASYAQAQAQAQAQAPSLTDTEKAMLFLMLSQTNEAHSHQLRGAKDNQTYIHSDGHREAVYNGDGELVQDGINDGSYNYAHPEKEPFAHYNLDIAPWITMGMSRGDPTSPSERIYAYMGDVEGGIVKARKIWATQPADIFIQASRERAVPDGWQAALEAPDTRAVFKLIDGSAPMEDEDIVRALKSLNESFKKVY